MRRNPVGRSIAITFCAGLFATPAFAQMTCAALGSYLASQPKISQFVPPPPAAQVPVQLPPVQVFEVMFVPGHEAPQALQLFTPKHIEPGAFSGEVGSCRSRRTG